MAWNGYREARRNRVTVVVAGFALVLLFSTSLLVDVTVLTFDRVITDMGLGVMSLLLVAICIYLSCGVISTEIERRTIFLVVTRPVSRSRFIVARFAGTVFTLLTLLLVMTAAMITQFIAFKTPVTESVVAALIGLIFELTVLSAAGFFFSSFSGPLVAASCTTGIYFAGHLSADLYKIGQRSTSEALKRFVTSIYYVLPNLERVNFRPQATYATPIHWPTVASGAAYVTCFTVVLVALACVIFERRDFK